MADEEELELDVNQPKSNKMTTILLIVLIVLVLIVGGVGAWLYLSNDSESDTGGDASSGDTNTEKVLKPLHYLTMVPEFVVNFGPGSKVRYLQVDLQVSTRDESVLTLINTYRPVLRNDILVLLSGQTYDQLRERSGKETLQKNILDTINRVVAEAMHPEKNKEAKDDKAADENQQAVTVKGPIENVYFTSFIMQ